MPLKPKFFLLVSAGIFSFLCGVYYLCFLIQLGSSVKAEWWVKDSYYFKDFLADAIQSPKIIIASGSNSLFGINSDIIKDITGYNVVNIATHAALDLDFYYYKIKNCINKGDIILLPLEFDYYYTDNVTSWFINNMLAWGWDDYLSQLPIADRLTFLFHTPKSRIYDGIINMNKQNPLSSRNKVIRRLINRSESKWKGYNYRSMNNNGEINIAMNPTSDLIDKYNKGVYYIKDRAVSDKFLKTYRKIHDLAENTGSRLILTWPVTMKNKSFDLSGKEDKKKVSKLAVHLHNKNIRVYCDPSEFNLDLNLFFNSEYHPNTEGTAIRSERLARCLNTILAARDRK